MEKVEGEVGWNPDAWNPVMSSREEIATREISPLLPKPLPLFLTMQIIHGHPYFRSVLPMKKKEAAV